MNPTELQLNKLSEEERAEAYNSGYLPFLVNGEGILRKVTLEEWLEKIKELEKFDEVEPPFIYTKFPSDYHKREYLSNISTRPLEEIKWLIEHFLPGELYGWDEFEKVRGRADLLFNHKTPSGKNLMEVSYTSRRWVLWAVSDGKLVRSPRETVNWVLDLVDDDPEQAIQVLHGYFAAQGQDLPDGAMDSLEDCIDLIRARYSLYSIPEDFIASLSSRQFERLVEKLYQKMGYDTVLTQQTWDGGKDVIATKTEKGHKTTIYVEVKRTQKVGPKLVRELKGVVLDNGEANKGVIVTSGHFSSEALDLVKDDARFELIDLEDFVKLMNRYHGINWTQHLNWLLPM